MLVRIRSRYLVVEKTPEGRISSVAYYLALRRERPAPWWKRLSRWFARLF